MRNTSRRNRRRKSRAVRIITSISKKEFLVLLSALIILTIVFVIKISVQSSGAPKEGTEYTISTEDTTVLAGVSEAIYENLNTEENNEVAYGDPNNYIYPYNLMSADWGSEIYEAGFKYYEIPEEYKRYGGCFPEVVQAYLFSICEQYGVDYYIAVALIEKESSYRYDNVGDHGNSIGYMQIYQKWHTERMYELGITDLYNPYSNMMIGVDTLAEINNKYLESSGLNCVLMVYNMGEAGAKKLWKKGIYSSEYSRGIINRANEIKQELQEN